MSRIGNYEGHVRDVINIDKMERQICILKNALIFLSGYKIFNHRYSVIIIEKLTNWFVKRIVRKSIIK
jgi:hypothetical protein